MTNYESAHSYDYECTHLYNYDSAHVYDYECAHEYDYECGYLTANVYIDMRSSEVKERAYQLR